MSLTLFIATLLMALLGPLVAVSYVRPILVRVLRSLCPTADGGASAAEFWVRSAYVLAVCGTVILMLLWGRFDAHADAVVVLRQSLLLVFGGVFISIALIARNVWKQVMELLAADRLRSRLRSETGALTHATRKPAAAAQEAV